MNPVRERKILVVDDEDLNRYLLINMLTKLGHAGTPAASAMEALQTLDTSFDLILSDVMMPQMDGFEMVRRIRATPELRDIPVIMVTALSDQDARLRAVEAGANDFIAKPVDFFELKVRTGSLLKQKDQQDEIKAYQKDLSEMVDIKTQELRRAMEDLDRAHQNTIHHLAAAAEFRDDNTAAHIRRMSSYSGLIAQKMGLPDQRVSLILTASPMHDVGKIGIPDNILLKNGKLNPREWEIMKTHTTIGGRILSGGASEYMIMGAEIALSHHEKWDGSGYPQGLRGRGIPLAGRICAVADVFDALTSKRPYKDAFSVEKSMNIMKEGRGTHFDPRVLDVFLANMDGILKIKARHQDESWG